MALSSGERSLVLEELRENCGFKFDENNLSPSIRQEITNLGIKLADINPLRHKVYETSAASRVLSSRIVWGVLIGAVLLLVGLAGAAGSPGAGLLVMIAGFVPFLWVIGSAKPRLTKLEKAHAGYQSQVEWLEAQLKMKVNDLAKTITQELSELHEQTLHPRQVNLNISMDFTWLRTEIEKGGLMLSAVKCPQCGSKLDLPASGNFVKCEYCGSSIHAVDVFDKLKSLLK